MLRFSHLLRVLKYLQEFMNASVSLVIHADGSGCISGDSTIGFDGLTELEKILEQTINTQNIPSFPYMEFSEGVEDLLLFDLLKLLTFHKKQIQARFLWLKFFSDCSGIISYDSDLKEEKGLDQTLYLFSTYPELYTFLTQGEF
jgi:hypothetical protein